MEAVGKGMSAGGWPEMARSPFTWLPAGDLKDDLLYDYFRELEDTAKLEDPED